MTVNGNIVRKERFLRLFWICVIFIAMLSLSGCKISNQDRTNVKQHKIVDLFIGDSVVPELQNIPKGLNESDYTWTIISEITNSDKDTGLI